MAADFPPRSEPYADKAETVDGMRAILLVSGISQFVADGIESPEYLTETIRLASDISGIPQTVFEAYAEFIMAMHMGYHLRNYAAGFWDIFMWGLDHYRPDHGTQAKGGTSRIPRITVKFGKERLPRGRQYRKQTPKNHRVWGNIRCNRPCW